MYTKRPNFNNFGRFFLSKNKKIRVHPKLKKPGSSPGFNIVPRAMQGAFATMWCKVQNLFQILAHGCKQLAQPCQYWLSVPHEQDKNGND